MTKTQRLIEFQKRLLEATPAHSFDEAYGQICRILNQVEDEFTLLAYNPLLGVDDGRLYPPLWDRIKLVKGVWRLRTTAHILWIGKNGAISIDLVVPKDRILEKPGANGRRIGER